MCEITINNFGNKFEEIKNSLESAKFIAIDCEFSALYPLQDQQPSLFDNPVERYRKLRKNVEITTPIQIGLTAFHFNPDKNLYDGEIFNFYVVPAAFPGIQKNICFQTDTLSFLKLHQFNFDKFANEGIPFLNSVEEEHLRKSIQELDETDSTIYFDLNDLLIKYGDFIKQWYAKNDCGPLLIPEIYQKYKNNIEFLYFIHKNFRERFKGTWTFVENNEFVIKKVTEKEITQLKITDNLRENTIKNLLGFTKVFRLLTQLKKPIIGHNIFYDLLSLTQSFEQPLPKTYRQYKSLINKLFPVVFDTKTISYELRRNWDRDKRWDETALKDLFEFFKNGGGRHLASFSPAIESNCPPEKYNKFHEAGWDSFCAGYIFIRLAYLNIYDKHPKAKIFMTGELIAGLSHLKNCVNIIRGSTSFAKLDGDDPISTRPPWLVVESAKNQPLNITKVTSILSSFGAVDVKKLPASNNTRALIAVDNFGNARKILQKFHSDSEFQVKKYNILRHSPIAKAVLWGSMTISGALVIWISHKLLKTASQVQN